MEVFWERGFEGASCGDLLAAMEINAGSMYAAFGDKQSLYQQALALYCDNVFSHLAKMLEGPGSPLERITAVMEAIGEQMAKPDGRGCLIGNTLIEFGNTDSAIAQTAREMAGRLQRALESTLSAAQTAGELSPQADPSRLASFLVTTIQGLNVMARLQVDRQAVRGVIDTALAALH